MSNRPVVGKKTTAENEQLPFPVVEYPSSGAFIGFRRDDNSRIHFCECARQSLRNYIECQKHWLGSSHQNVTCKNIAQPDFPEPVVERICEKEIGIENLFEEFDFEHDLCHKCNDVVPKYRYTSDMYGTKFKQNYGWYMKQKGFEYGVCNSASDSLLTDVLPEELPENIIDLIDEGLFDELSSKTDQFETLKEKRRKRESEINTNKKEEIRNIDIEVTDEASFREKDEIAQEIREKYDSMDPLPEDEQNKLEELKKEIETNSSRVREEIENAVRREVGHYEKGNRWTSETILYQLIESEFGDKYTIKRHYRPDWMEGLEIDIYLVEPSVGIEYQGVQHYEVVDHWGGEEGFEERQQRDKQTRRLCRKNNVELVEVRYDEELSSKLIESKIKPIINNRIN